MNIFPDKRTCYSRKMGNGEVLTEFVHRGKTL